MKINQQTNMKRLLILFAAVAIVACSDTKKPPAPAGKKVESETTTIELAKADFLKKVANYEMNKDWKYLGDKPAVIDFYATWCGPCKMVAPILEDLAAEYDGRIYVYKIDVDKENEIASVFGIYSIPSLLFIPMNGNPKMMQGAMDKESYKKAIEEILLGK